MKSMSTLPWFESRCASVSAAERANDRLHYRGYQLETSKSAQGWRVSVHPNRAELPILRRSYLGPLVSKAEVIAEARRRIDRVLLY